MNLLVAGNAERLEIRLVMRPAVSKRQDVVDERRLDVASSRRAAFAKRMRMKITRTHLRPAAAVPNPMVVSTDEVLV